MKRIFRYEVPVDDRPHGFALNPGAKILTVTAVNDAGPVEFCVEHDDAQPVADRHFIVFGTGHLLPKTAAWAGTCPRAKHGYVWHLYEIC